MGPGEVNAVLVDADGGTGSTVPPTEEETTSNGGEGGGDDVVPTDDNDGGEVDVPTIDDSTTTSPCAAEAEASSLCILMSGDACDTDCTTAYMDNPTLNDEAAINPEVTCILSLLSPCAFLACCSTCKEENTAFFSGFPLVDDVSISSFSAFGIHKRCVKVCFFFRVLCVIIIGRMVIHLLSFFRSRLDRSPNNLPSGKKKKKKKRLLHVK